MYSRENSRSIALFKNLYPNGMHVSFKKDVNSILALLIIHHEYKIKILLKNELGFSVRKKDKSLR